MKPGSEIELTSPASRWIVDEATVEGLAVVVQLRPAAQPINGVLADAGRSISATDAVAAKTSLALLEISEPVEDKSTVPVLYLAASSVAERWRPVPVEIDAGGAVHLIRTARRKTVLGIAINGLPGGDASLLDLSTNLDVQLVDPEQWLESCDAAALAEGANLAAVGSELVQFGSAEPIGPGFFRLSKLLRGRRETEWAINGHEAGETFALLDFSALVRLDLPSPMRAATIRARARGLADSDFIPISKQIRSTALRLQGHARTAGDQGSHEM